MGNKLNNISEIQKLLDGEHSSQKRKSVSLSKKKESAHKTEITERQKRFKDLRKKYNKRSVCPECGKVLNTWQDLKFLKMTNMCMNCKIKEDTQLIIEDKFEEYEYNFMYNNLIHFLNDAEKDVSILKDIFSKAQYINEDGSIEEWNLPYTPEEMQEKVETDFIKLKEDLLKRYEEYLSEIKNREKSK